MLITESVTDTMISLYADNVLTYISDPVNSINFTTINKWLSSFMSQKKRNTFAMFKRIWGGLKSQLRKYSWAAQLKRMAAWLSQDKDTI